MIGADFARAVDPALIAQDAGITPDPWQADLLRSNSRSGADAVQPTSRQDHDGRLHGAYTAIYRRPGGLVIIVSPSQRQSGEIFRTVMAHHSNLKDVPELKAVSALRAEMASGQSHPCATGQRDNRPGLQCRRLDCDRRSCAR